MWREREGGRKGGGEEREKGSVRGNDTEKGRGEGEENDTEKQEVCYLRKRGREVESERACVVLVDTEGKRRPLLWKGLEAKATKAKFSNYTNIETERKAFKALVAYKVGYCSNCRFDMAMSLKQDTSGPYSFTTR